MQVVSEMIRLDVVTSGICSADAATGNNKGTEEHFRTAVDKTRKEFNVAEITEVL
jgi:hypothetical protein